MASFIFWESWLKFAGMFTSGDGRLSVGGVMALGAVSIEAAVSGVAPTVDYEMAKAWLAAGDSPGAAVEAAASAVVSGGVPLPPSSLKAQNE